MMGTTPVEPAPIGDALQIAEAEAPPSGSQEGRLALGKILVFAAPAAGQSFMFNFVNMYLLVFATEKLDQLYQILQQPSACQAKHLVQNPEKRLR